MTPAPKLHELIETVHADAGSTDQLELLAAASRLASELDDVSDALLGHFVDQCRRSGRSWTEISGALGVTKQAAHKRFSFAAETEQRMTPRARKVLDAASAAARAFGHNYIGTEHILLGMYDQPESIGTRVLVANKITGAKVQAAIMRWTPSTTGAVNDTPAFTARAAAVIEGALREALRLGHNYVGTEHLLLAMYRDPECLAAKILVALRLTPEKASKNVVEFLGGVKATASKKQP